MIGRVSLSQLMTSFQSSQNQWTPTDTVLIILRGIAILCSLTILVCTIFVRKKQPFRSRAIIPYIATAAVLSVSIALMLLRISRKASFADLETFVCFFAAYFAVPVSGVMPLLVTFQVFRYLLILHFQRKKNFVWKKAISNNFTLQKNDFDREFKFIKFFTSTWTLMLVGISLYLMWCLLYAILEIVLRTTRYVRHCALNELPLVGSATLLTFLILNIILEIIMVIWDIVVSYKYSSRFNLRTFFIDDDPYYFRIEFILSVFVSIVYVIANVIIPIDGDIAREISSLVNLHLLWTFTLIVFPMMISYYRWWRDRKRISVKEQTSSTSLLLEILENEISRDMLRQFCQNEWSVENMILYENIQYLKKLPDTEKLDYAQIIVENHLIPRAPLEVNLNHTIVQKITESLKKEGIDEKVWKELEDEVMINLADTASRLIKTHIFQQYKKSNVLQEKLQKQVTKN